MSAPKKKIIKKTPANVPPVPKVKRAPQKVSSSLFVLMENHLIRQRYLYLSLVLITAVVLAFLCFDNKISTANDDALYIESAARYAKDFFGKGTYYTGTAPFYVIVLGLIIKLFGIKLFILKTFSILFFCLALFFIYRAFEKRIPYTILFSSLILTAINFPFLLYASLTYTETFSLMIFALILGVFFKIFDKTDGEDSTIKNYFPLFVLTGVLLFILMITRNVALAAVGVMVIFLIYRKKYIPAAISVSGFAAAYVVYNLALKYIWKVEGSQFSSQGNVMLNKDAYQPQLGRETSWGFVVRFWENCQIYISSRFYYVLGFREEMSPNNIPLTLFTIGLIVWSLVLMHKKKQYNLVFTTLFFSGLLSATFLSLHTSWGQTRLIMLYLPFILINIFYLLYYYGERFKFLQILLPFIFFVLFFVSFKTTLQQASERFPVFRENMSGDATFGYTPDWQNYIKMTKWCAQNLPNDLIAVRKAPMSFIFSEGKEFYPIYNTPTENPDSLLAPFIQKNPLTNKIDTVKYFMTAELRLDPSRYIEGQFIGTMHRYAYYIGRKYPNAFGFVHREGEVEQSELYKINYAYIDSVKSSGTK